MEISGETDSRNILGPIAHIYRSHLAYMAKELEAYRLGSGQFDFLMILYIATESLRRPLQRF